METLWGTIQKDNSMRSHLWKSSWFRKNPKKFDPWNKTSSPIHPLQLVWCEMASFVFSKLEEVGHQGVSWMSHSSSSLTNVTLTKLDIYLSLLVIQRKYAIFHRHMQYFQQRGGILALGIVKTNKITFNINKYI